MRRRCICGCGERVAARHHVVYAQHVRAGRRKGRELADLLTDARNLVDVAYRCHADHHARARPYPLAMLPDSAFAFAGEVLGPAAFDYLRRRYAGDDDRLSALLSAADTGRHPARMGGPPHG